MSDLVIQHCPLETENVPEGWELVSLSDFIDDIQTGFASGHHNRDGEGVPHLRPMNISPRGTIDMNDLRYVAPDKNPLRLRRGDVLFNNTNSPAWVGKTAYIGTDDELAFSNHMTRLRTPEDVDPHFLAHQLQFLCTSGYFQHQCKKHVNQASINRSFLGESTPFLLPRTAEQRRIVEKIEALQERSRNARETLAEVGPLLERFRHSLLAAAFRGDLTADWRAANLNTEPAAELLARIRQERRQKWEQAELAKYKAKGKQPPDGWQSRYKEAEPVDESVTHDLPEGWCWATVDTTSFVTKLAGFEYTKFVNYADDGDLAVIKAENAGPLGFRYTSFSRIHSSTVKHLTRSQVRAGDVLMVFVGAGVAQVACVPNDQAYFLGPNIAMIRLKLPFLRSKFLEHFLRSPAGFDLAMSFTKAVAQPSLSMGTIRKIPVPIPPIKEQKIIETLIEAAIEQVIQLEDILRQSESAVSQLDLSVLAKAFRGELVPQDPNDEPASILLERIRKARESEKPNKNRKGGRKGIPNKVADSASSASAAASLIDVLRKAGKRMHVDDLQAASGLSSTKFYSQLKDAIASGAIKEEFDDDNRYLVPAK